MTPEQKAEQRDRAVRLENAINRMAVRYGEAVSDSALSVAGSSAEIKATRARFRRFRALMRLTRALSNLAGDQAVNS